MSKMITIHLITNEVFAQNAWYFRNALVRANYTNVEKGIFETTRYIELFLENLLFNGNNELKNRYLHIRWNEKEDIGQIKVDITKNKVDIEQAKISKTIRKNIEILYQALKDFEYFGRTEIIDVLKMSPSGASKLISKLLDAKIIIKVLKHGKGKYCFNKDRVNYE